ncbi:GntR family transcriptional regulator [Oceanobacillus senegalensis]|uniref:GntR family transcriptional regulator n=1 Tax=Oceanobacillus senegalensis TaxID=1936063 RepID=UPI000A3090AB|nr:GntR family transcriptional regulator [Oceanobacillus senegalensis]
MGIKKSHVSDQVLAYLRKKIMLQELKEGDHLKETELSKELNVSRGPVREAIAKLETEGLVDTPSNGRTVVVHFSTRDIKNLYDSRILLEKQALNQIESSVLEERKDQLFAYVKQMQNSFNKGVRDIHTDLAFHGLLVEMANNKTLVQLWNSLQGIIHTLIDVTSEYVQMRQQEIINQHSKILNALVNRDVENAQELLRQHLEEASNYYTSAVESINKGGEI